MELGERAASRGERALERGSGAHAPGPSSEPDVEIRRSARRRRTIQARWEGDRLVLMVPAGASREQEQQWVDQMRARMQRRRRAPSDDGELTSRAERLAARYDLPKPLSVRWVDNQHSRWGSCTPAHGTIRISDRLRRAPDYVLDYVLVHELAHLVVAAHDARFLALVARYPRVERAQGFLEGYAAGEPDAPQEC